MAVHIAVQMGKEVQEVSGPGVHFIEESISPLLNRHLQPSNIGEPAVLQLADIQDGNDHGKDVWDDLWKCVPTEGKVT